MSLIRSIRIAPRFRHLIYAVVALVAISGIAWIALGFAVDAEDFTDPLRLWRHRALVLHGVSAYALVWLVGSLLPQHQWGGWQARRNRGSGGVLSAALLLLAISGLLLYYPPQDDWREASSLLHQVIGLLLLALLPLHVVLGRRQHRSLSHAAGVKPAR
jgi:hypothetical protein